MTEPRRLRLATLDNVVDEVERLHRNGYTQAGKWNLSQICEHLSDWMTYSMDGFPPVPLVGKIFLGALRVFQGKKLLYDWIEKQSMSAGQQTITQSIHGPDGDEAASVARLKAVIQRLEEHRGMIHPSPLFGTLNRSELIGLQMAHSVHHLNFLIPKEAS